MSKMHGEVEWVACAACSLAVRTRAELIRHVESDHMEEPDSVVVEDMLREDVRDAQRRLQKTSGGEGWTEHMFMDRRVLRCKGVVGEPYYQHIKGVKTIVQQLCPATFITSSPTDTCYKLSMFWRHVGHPSTPFEPKYELLRDVCNRLKGISTTVMEGGKRLPVETLRKVLKKIDEIESILRTTEMKLVVPSIKEPSRKLKLEEVVQKVDVEKAVDEALEKYIKSKINEDVKSDIPKIVNSFSLNVDNGKMFPLKQEDDDIDAFVKDVELLVNNGKTYEAAENRNKLGRVGSNMNEGTEKILNVDPKLENSEEKLQLNPVVEMEMWSKSSFNDTYKAFISRELGTKESGKNMIKSEVKEGTNSTEPMQENSDTYLVIRKKKRGRPARSVSENKTFKKSDIAISRKAKGLTQEELNTRKTVKNTKHKRQATPVEIESLKKATQDNIKSRKVKVHSQDDMITNNLGKYTKRAKLVIQPETEHVKLPMQDVVINRQVKESTQDDILITKEFGRKRRRSKLAPLDSEPIKHSLQDNKIPKVKESTKCTQDDYANTIHKNTKNAKLPTTLKKTIHNTEIIQPSNNNRRLSAPIQTTKKSIRERTQSKLKQSRYSLDQKSHMFPKEHTEITEEKVKRSKTGLKSKPTNKPKASANKMSTKKPEFIVQEQDNDVNILIIRI